MNGIKEYTEKLFEDIKHIDENSNEYWLARDLQKVLEYMKENDSYTIPELVKISGMSKSRFYEAFLTIVGVPPIKMKHRLQAYKGELLLKSTDLSIEEITKKLGFLSEAHFRKVFHSRYGECSPLKFRKEFQNNNRE